MSHAVWDTTAEQLAVIFFESWYCENGLPLEVVCDRDKLFVSKFWKTLMELTGVSIKMSSAFHPQTDGASERTNKTVNQAIRFHVERNQTGWKRALPKIRFNIMNSVNASTGFSGFQLRFGKTCRVIPPLLHVPVDADAPAVASAKAVIDQMAVDVADARDNLMLAKNIAVALCKP